MVELRYCYPKIWADSVDVLGFVKNFLPPIEELLYIKNQPKVAVTVCQSELMKHLPRKYAERWRFLQQRDKDYDEKLLEDANAALSEVAAKITPSIQVQSLALRAARPRRR